MGDSRMTSSTMDDVFYWVKLFTKVLKIYFYSFSQQLKTIFFVHKGTKGTKLLLIVHELNELNEFFSLCQKRPKRFKKLFFSYSQQLKTIEDNFLRIV